MKQRRCDIALTLGICFAIPALWLAVSMLFQPMNELKLQPPVNYPPIVIHK